MESVSNGTSEAEELALRPLDQLFWELRTGLNGLNHDEVARRLKEHGPNVLPERKKSPWRNVLVQFKNAFNILLFIAALLSFVSGFASNDPGSINMGIVILLVVAVSIVFNLFQEHRAEQAVRAIRELIPTNARVKRGGQVEQIPVSEIVTGDIIITEAGNKVPADARLITSFELSVDNSSLTGESEPQPRSVMNNPGAVRELVAHSNLIFAGTTIVAGSAEAVVIATGSATEFGRVVAMTHNIEESSSPLQVELDRTAKLNLVVAVTVGILFLLIALFWLHLDVTSSLLFMIGVMVSLVPEGFQITLTLALALSSLTMSKKNVVVKRLSSVETLGSVTVICSDKTGTITEGQMTARLAWIGGTTFDITGEGYGPEGAVLLNGQRITANERKDLLTLCEVACLANTATVLPPPDKRKARWTAIGDSTEAALLVLAAKAGMASKDALDRQPRIGMIPFESSRKMMTSLHKTSDGEFVAYVKGAGSEILSRSTEIYYGGRPVPMTDDIYRQVTDQIDSYAREAYRVLALAVRKLPNEPIETTSEVIESNLTLVGLVAILDPPRSETTEAVRQARNAGVRIVMMTGDHELTAEAIARKVGIFTTSKNEVWTGQAISQLSDLELSKVLEEPELVFARISPDQKLRIVSLLRAKGESVAVTGDGVNDAPALLEADIGIAMGQSGTDVARESADMVLLDDNFASIVHGIEQGRTVYENLKKFIVYVFAHNWAELITFIVFVMLGTPLPLTVLMVLAIDLIMEIPPSLALTLEPPEPGTMDRMPRSKSERLFSPSALARSAYIGIIIGMVSILWCFSYWAGSGWILGTSTVPDQIVYLTGTTITMAAIMAGQLGTVFATRTNVRSALTVSLARNKWLVAGVIVSVAILITVIYLPIFNSIFATAPFDLTTLILLYAIAPVIFGLEEVRKYFLRTYIFPAKPVLAQPVLTSFVYSRSEKPVGKEKVRTPSLVKARPIVVPIAVSDWRESTVKMAVNIAKYVGSRLIILRIIDDMTKPEMIIQLEGSVARTASSQGVPFEFLEVNLVGKEHIASTLVSSVREALRRINPDWILLPVDRGVFEGERASLRLIRWIEKLAPEKRLLLISNWETKSSDIASPKVLIPAVEDFKLESFEVAAAVKEGANIPEVNVVAAKLVEMPSIVPLHSYKPESLVNADMELATFRSLSRRVIIQGIRPIVLLVREASRDLLQYMKEKVVDIIILEGDWGEGKQGYLGKKEHVVAMNAQCTVVIALPRRNPS